MDLEPINYIFDNSCKFMDSLLIEKNHNNVLEVILNQLEK